jgi:hypothetical protein
MNPQPQPRGVDRQGIPRFQLEESFRVSGFRYKKTDSDAHPEAPEPSVVRPPTAGWSGTPSRQLNQSSTYATAAPSRPWPATTSDSAGESLPGRRGDPRAGRWPGSTTSDITAHSGAETELGQPGWTQCLAGQSPAAVGAT